LEKGKITAITAEISGKGFAAHGNPLN